MKACGSCSQRIINKPQAKNCECVSRGILSTKINNKKGTNYDDQDSGEK